MTRLDPSSARRRERIVGAVVVLVGVAVLVLSIVALAKAGDGPGSDLAGPTVTLPAGTSSSASGSGTANGSPSTSPTSTPTATGSTTGSTTGSATTSPGGVVGSQPLVVLNNTRVTNLASTVAATLTQGGWTVTDTGNLDQDILSTCAYYDPDVSGAKAAAEALMEQFPKILRVKEKFGALPAGPVVVVIADDYTAN